MSFSSMGSCTVYVNNGMSTDEAFEDMFERAKKRNKIEVDMPRQAMINKALMEDTVDEGSYDSQVKKITWDELGSHLEAWLKFDMDSMYADTRE